MKLRQVGVYARDSSAIEVKGQAVSTLGNFDPRDGAFMRSKHRYTGPSLGSDIQARVKMTGSNFPEVATEFEWNRERRMQRILGMGFITQPTNTGSHQGHDPQNPIHSLSHVRKLPRWCHPLESKG